MSIDLNELCKKTLNSEILWALGEGRAYTLTELTKLLKAEEDKIAETLEDLRRKKILILMERRHEYYRLADLSWVSQLSSLDSILPAEHKKRIQIDNSKGMKYCRSCYDHLAGEVGVALTDCFLSKDFIRITGEEAGLTAKGEQFFESLGMDIKTLKASKRTLVKPCLDFSERRYHLRGTLAAAFLEKLFENKWLKRIAKTREIQITQLGKTVLKDKLGIEF